jgi:uroporphyrinogen III methyltransferase / synthase
VTWMTFTSSSTAKNMAELLGPNYRQRLKGVKVASIGPVTSATLRELGLEPEVEGTAASVEGLVAAIGGVRGVPAR